MGYRSYKGNRRISGGAADYIIPIGLVSLVGYVVYKYFISGTATGTGAQAAAQTANVTQASTAAYQQSAATTPQAVSDNQLNQMIGTMMRDAQSNTSLFSGSSYQEDIVSQMGQLVNTTDLLRLIQLWGTRPAAGASGTICDTFDIGCTPVDFGTFIHATLTSDQIANLNALLSANGINYTFS